LAINITFTIDEAYLPLISEIDGIAEECESSRSGVIRGLLCDALQFTPKEPINDYNANNLKCEKKRFK
jgi:hypothetical protein